MHVVLEAGRYRLSVATEHSLNLRRPVTVKLARGAHNKLGIIMHIRSLLSNVEVSISDLLPEILRGHCSYRASILRGFQGAHSGCTQLLVLRFPQRHPFQWKVFEFVTQKSRIVIHHNNHLGGVGKWATVCSFFWGNVNNQKYVWIILLKMTFFGICQGKVATSDRWGGHVCKMVVKFSQDLTYQK